MKIIYINGKYLTQPITGVQRYAYEIVRELDKLIESTSIIGEYRFVILAPNKKMQITPDYRQIKVIQSKFGFTSFLWEQFWLPFITKKCTLINLAGSAPMFKFDQFCTFHDAAVFENSFSYRRIFVWWYKILFKFQSKRCLKIFTVSKFSRERLSFFLKIPKSRIEVISNSSNHMQLIEPDDLILKRLGVQNKKYFLAIASANPSKNINKLINAFQSLDYDPDVFLVLAGGAGSVFSSNTESASENARVINAGRVSDSELKALYLSALAFIFPSLYEGFGIPPLEAMACNCPVIASNLAVVREVCADAVLYIDPHSINSMIGSLNQALEDDALLSKLAADGVSRSNEFTWRNSARVLFSHISIQK